jgi:hypothetical protein
MTSTWSNAAPGHTFHSHPSRRFRASIDWNFLIRGSLIGNVVIENPTVSFVAGAEEAEEQLEISQE